MKILKSLILSGILLNANGIIEQKINLKINNKEFKIPILKEVTIDLDGKKYNITASIEKIATFKHENIEFDFPSNLNYGYDDSAKDKGLIFWSLNGDNAIVMILEFHKEYPKEVILNKLLNKYKQMHATLKRENIELNIKNGKKIKGEFIIVELANIILSQEIFIFYSNNKTYVLVLQDLMQNGKHTQEYQKVKDIVRKSLTIKGLSQR